MTNEQAIAMISHIKEYIVDNQGDKEYGGALDMAIEALEQQIELEPVDTWDDGISCPICGGFATCQKWKNGKPYTHNFEHCPTCGQKLDWT